VRIEARFLEVVTSPTRAFGLELDGNVTAYDARSGGVKPGNRFTLSIGTGGDRHKDEFRDEPDTSLGMAFSLGHGVGNQDVFDLSALVKGARPVGQAGYDRRKKTLVAAPTVRVDDIDTAVILNTDKAFVVGDLIHHRRTGVRNDVPLLSNIPAVGRLFRSQAKYRDRRVLLIIVTPSLIGIPGG